MHDQGMLTAKGLERLRYRFAKALAVDAEQLAANAGGIGQRSDEVEECAQAKLAARPDGMTHRTVVRRCEHEAEADVVDGSRDLLRRQIQGHAEALEEIGAAAGTRDGAVAVLGHLRSRRRGDEAGGGRDVEQVRPVAARAHEIDQVRPLHGDGRRHLAHYHRRAGDLLDCLALHAQPQQQGADLRIRGLAGHDAAHHRRHLVAAEILPLGDTRQGLLHVHRWP